MFPIFFFIYVKSLIIITIKKYFKNIKNLLHVKKKFVSLQSQKYGGLFV